LINIYGFSTTPGLSEPRCWQSSFLFPAETKRGATPHQPINTLLFNPVAFQDGASTNLEPAENPMAFLQAWALSTDLALGSALCVVHQGVPGTPKLPSFWKQPPTVGVKKIHRKFLSEKSIQDDFFVDDRDDEENVNILAPTYAVRDQHVEALKERQNDLRRRMDWSLIFKSVFPYFSPKYSQDPWPFSGFNSTSTMHEIIAALNDHIYQVKDSGGIALTTL
jgi:hypothetical protein